ncbi:hypothetical protein ADIMK_2891 [Marinobacterium lacunae]|uniref:Uncharacterized protein n=1 Tax=Marinobacterium lacunae TaxID=1232683 RepID=A0A081FWL6_9GAMM|nr:hypothetical protein ADIMK_2891 [Marinobacterium lacunae]
MQSNGNPLRAFYAFDPKRRAILLCAGNKAGKGQEKRFYTVMVPIADQEFDWHLETLKQSEE